MLKADFVCSFSFLLFQKAYNPLKDGFPKSAWGQFSRQVRRVQKGDGQKVIVIKTSAYCIDEHDVDIVIIVNDGVFQPKCENAGIFGPDHCSYALMYFLHSLIVKTDLPAKWTNGRSSGMERRNGRPVVYRTVSNNKGFFSNGKVEKFSISFTNPPLITSSILHMHTINFDDIEDLLQKYSKNEKILSKPSTPPTLSSKSPAKL